MASATAVFNHLVLPLKLPDQQEDDVDELSGRVWARCLDACAFIQRITPGPETDVLQLLVSSLRQCEGIPGPRLEVNNLIDKFADLKPGGLLIIRLAAQNAALLLYTRTRDGNHTVVFEAFETSPISQAVLASDTAMDWLFPGCAAEIPLATFQDDSFKKNLAIFLHKASEEALSRFSARASKAGSSVMEVRDTPSPGLISQFLMTLLGAVGNFVEVPGLRKRVRDDVMHGKGEMPWRRCASWLVLRVSMQRQLGFTLGAQPGRLVYKLVICVVLEQFLDSCSGDLAPEATMTLRAKLCRRLAKLEQEKQQMTEPLPPTLDTLFAVVGSKSRETIARVTRQIEIAWNNYKQSITRIIPRLPWRASQDASQLTLCNSRSHLYQRLQRPMMIKRRAALNQPPESGHTETQIREFSLLSYTIERFEEDLDRKLSNQRILQGRKAAAFRCTSFSEDIFRLFSVVGENYSERPDQMSLLILRVVQLWVEMDKSACSACPLLWDYSPLFPPEALDVLHLARLSELQKLQAIQTYLKERQRRCRKPEMTIFNEPNVDSFQVRYFTEAAEGARLQVLLNRVTLESRNARDSKEREWQQACREYDDLTEKIVTATCLCTILENGERDVRGCTKCWYWRHRNRMSIKIHEDFLPAKAHERAAVIFELGIPEYLQEYRNATWRIFRKLGFPGPKGAAEDVRMRLQDYEQLKCFKTTAARGISLASSSKSFLQTHYAQPKMKADLASVLLPLGLKFRYYDQSNREWLADLSGPVSFQHHCGFVIPRALLAVSVRDPRHPAWTDGPSSYETLASATKCPRDMSRHEFMALQRLLGGKSRRWLTMLVELGSTNINMSDEASLRLMAELAVQAGPSQMTDDVLRDVHVVFRDELFCQRLLEQVEKRISTMKENWRETHCMDLMVTIALRLHDLASDEIRQGATKQLKAARQTTLSWVMDLREKCRDEPNADAVKRLSQYAYRAAIICRRTFTVLDTSEYLMDAEELRSFVIASVALQQNLTDVSTLGSHIRGLLMKDLKLAFRLRNLIQESVKESPSILGEAIMSSMRGDPNMVVAGRFSNWDFSDGYWVAFQMDPVARDGQPQTVQYHLYEGHLKVNGQTLGKLPVDIMKSESVKNLFGDRNLRCFPSSGELSHVLDNYFEGNEVHLGTRDGQVVVQAIKRKQRYEYIPANLFHGPEKNSFDLPAELIVDCTHWLCLETGLLEVRRKPRIWCYRSGDWLINVHTGQAYRRSVRLVDPRSEICQQIYKIFSGFESPQHVTVFQPMKYNLTVYLHRLKLTFKVNRKNLLGCDELRSEVDPNQDAGALYGLQSKIVLRDNINMERRSILVGLGNMVYERRGMHVSVRTQETTAYARYEIDTVLGRLSCPPEPRLLYSKALFHALTSFVLPDALTHSTGTEEAYDILSSGCCQPWMPLHEENKAILREIQGLSPTREYYPPDKRVLQRVSWNQNLTVTIQHDCFHRLIEDILAKLERLEVFSSTNVAKASAFRNHKSTDTHLRDRAEMQRNLYERTLSEAAKSSSHGPGRVYKARDGLSMTAIDMHVYKTVMMLQQRPFSVCLDTSLAEILEKFPEQLIGGFSATAQPDTQSLDQLIDGSICEQWGSLVNYCRSSSPGNEFGAIFRLGLLSFGRHANYDAIKILCAFSVIKELGEITPPSCDVFRGFKFQHVPSVEYLVTHIKSAMSELQEEAEESSEQSIDAGPVEQKAGILEAVVLAEHLAKQWPSINPSRVAFDLEFDSDEPDSSFIHDVYEAIEPEWRRLVDNKMLSSYVAEVESALTSYICLEEADISLFRNWRFTPQDKSCRMRTCLAPSLAKQLVAKKAPKVAGLESLSKELQKQATFQPPMTADGATAQNDAMCSLKTLLQRFAESQKPLWKQYGTDLLESYNALLDRSSHIQRRSRPPSLAEVDRRITVARYALDECLQTICSILSTNSGAFDWLSLGNLRPRVTPVTVLQLLRTRDKNSFGQGMKELLVAYGTLIATLQWLLRIKREYMRNDMQNTLLEQWNDKGHENWDPFQFPDWLLLEIESNMLIRQEQVEVAHAIIQPCSSANSVLQLNMGKGKTSCIVPMVVSVLADSEQLCRLIVPKALTQQAAQILQSRIGGLIGREIRHVPFSRRTRTSHDTHQLYVDLHREIRDCSGVMLANPEHILSYKLSGLQRLADGKLEEACAMSQGQDWLDATCRDVLDESDFTLAVKTQLIYPSGQLVPVDGHPDRWALAQSLLSLVEERLDGLCMSYPQGIHVLKRPAAFPMIFMINSDVEKVLRQGLIEAIVQGKTPIIPSSVRLSKTCIKSVWKVLSDDVPETKAFERVKRALAAKPSVYKGILLARGLLLQGILFLCLRKRWNVQYGLHPDRDPIAVPYEAKGVPSAQAEFGHPDVAILLTCLAFYYSGLTVAQFRHGLGRVLKSDDPASEYDRWTAGCATLPSALRNWNLINVDDYGQVDELWRHLRLTRSVLNHYMNNFVFPRYAKQFDVKLQASGWDLPLFSPDTEHGAARTTGFSGTNDNRRMLPLLIQQDDLVSLKHTSAEVLMSLLEGRNREYIVTQDGLGGRLSEEALLATLHARDIRILIDAGAYILEMDNRSLIKKWLEIDTEAKAGVYLGADDNRAWVQYRKGKDPVPLLATPFADNLSDCLIYLDEAHTRGTDLQLPQQAHGALTLALGQTKDHAVQAAMRLRQLATTQSVSFWAPPEVHQSIVELSGKHARGYFDSADVVGWLLEQTCRANEQLHGLFVAQGLDFCRRRNAVLQNAGFLSDARQRGSVLGIVKSTEHLTLEQLYGNEAGGLRYEPLHQVNDRLQEIVTQLDQDKQELVLGQGCGLANVMDEVEQEREVEFQVEEIREVQKPRHRKALAFPGLHDAISRFVRTGVLDGGEGYETASVFLAQTVLGKQHDLRQQHELRQQNDLKQHDLGQQNSLETTGSKLFVSAQFSRTIETGLNRPADDDFIRGVEWVLWSPTTQTALVVIPEEAEMLIPLIRVMRVPPVHLMVYAAPVTSGMLQQFGSLGYLYALPALVSPGQGTPTWLHIELGILGARLYFAYSEYAALLEYLGALGHGGHGVEQSTARRRNLLTFVFEWLSIRHKGQDILHTPMGYVCQSRALSPGHAFFGGSSCGSDSVTRQMVRMSLGDADVEQGSDGSSSRSVSVREEAAEDESVSDTFEEAEDVGRVYDEDSE